MSNHALIGPWIRRFLLEHMVRERNLAQNTQASYRDTLVLFLPYVAQMVRKAVDKIEVEHISPDVVRSFLQHLEEERHCSIRTRNQRLAALHALARFIGEHSPEHVGWCNQVRAVPFKKFDKPTLPYLEKSEMDALLEAPDRNRSSGFRDYAILLFLYNSGARAEEVARLRIGDLLLDGPPAAVKIVGKGNKARLCPLWLRTIEALNPLVMGRGANEPVFLNRQKRPMTRFGIHALVKRYVLKAGKQIPTLFRKRISAHTIRHTTAVHLLRSGVDINTVRAWLGHVSVDTTNIYAEVDMEMKAKALASCEVPQPMAEGVRHWNQQPELMAFLKTL